MIGLIRYIRNFHFHCYHFDSEIKFYYKDRFHCHYYEQIKIFQICCHCPKTRTKIHRPWI